METKYQLSDPHLRKAIYDAFGGKCFYSGLKIALDEMHIDHIIPRSRGGEDSVYNLVPTRKDINLAKSNKFDKETFQPVIAYVKSVYAPKVLKKLDQIKKQKSRRSRKTSRSVRKKLGPKVHYYEMGNLYFTYPIWRTQPQEEHHPFIFEQFPDYIGFVRRLALLEHSDFLINCSPDHLEIVDALRKAMFLTAHTNTAGGFNIIVSITYNKNEERVSFVKNDISEVKAHMSTINPECCGDSYDWILDHLEPIPPRQSLDELKKALNLDLGTPRSTDMETQTMTIVPVKSPFDRMLCDTDPHIIEGKLWTWKDAQGFRDMPPPGPEDAKGITIEQVMEALEKAFRDLSGPRPRPRWSERHIDPLGRKVIEIPDLVSLQETYSDFRSFLINCLEEAEGFLYDDLLMAEGLNFDKETHLQEPDSLFISLPFFFPVSVWKWVRGDDMPTLRVVHLDQPQPSPFLAWSDAETFGTIIGFLDFKKEERGFAIEGETRIPLDNVFMESLFGKRLFDLDVLLLCEAASARHGNRLAWSWAAGLIEGFLGQDAENIRTKE